MKCSANRIAKAVDVIVAGVVRLRGHAVCPGWGVHDDLLETTH
jgi:hypothetical protein